MLLKIKFFLLKTNATKELFLVIITAVIGIDNGSAKQTSNFQTRKFHFFISIWHGCKAMREKFNEVSSSFHTCCKLHFVDLITIQQHKLLQLTENPFKNFPASQSTFNNGSSTYGSSISAFSRRLIENK